MSDFKFERCHGVMCGIAGPLSGRLTAVVEDEVELSAKFGVKVHRNHQRAGVGDRALAVRHGSEPVALPGWAKGEIPFRARSFDQVVTHAAADGQAMVEIL